MGGRPPAGRPDPARRRVRPASGGQRRAIRPTTATSSTTTTPGSPPPATRPRPGARSSSSRAPGRSSPRPDGAAAVAPFENPALATRRDRRRPGRGDRLAPRPGPRPRSPPPGSASTCTGWPATAVRERLGDAGLLASDLPDGIAIARKRLAAIAERRRAGKRLGFGPARRRPADRSASDRRRADDRRADRPAPPDRATRAGRRRPAAAAADRLARDRPRRAARQPRGAPAAWPAGHRRPAGRQGRRLRPRRGPGRPRRSRRPAPTASASPRSTRRSSCARGGIAAPILVLYPVPPALVADGARGSGSR